MSDTDTLTKSQFADRLGRHPSQVTRWIETGKLCGDALIGEGRSARINLPKALAQLNMSLDLGQQLAQSRPILPGQSAPSAPPREPAAQPMGDIDTVDAARAEQLRLTNEKLRQTIERGAREDAVAAGQLVDIGAVRRALNRQLQPLATIFDQLPAAIAKPLSEQFGVSYNEMLIAVRHAIRHQRHQMSETFEAMERSTVA
jgi:hypothetical protein